MLFNHVYLTNQHVLFIIHHKKFLIDDIIIKVMNIFILHLTFIFLVNLVIIQI